VSPDTFRELSDIAHSQAGILLGQGKQTLVAARVARRLRDLGLADEDAYVELLRNDGSGQELVHFLDVISTNFTSFYREPDHFEDLATDAAAARNRRGGAFRVWCAASSTGEEPYTLAITLASAFAGSNAEWRILATDISVRALTAAREGLYSPAQVAAVPAELRARSFTKEADKLRVRPELRQRVQFARLNLAQPPFPLRGGLDAVFCRNVMIYFDGDTRRALVREMARLCRPGALLVVGHSETLSGLSVPGLRAVRPSVYRVEEKP
jgi:chemotaxis protein methyltransferase CheR